MEAACLGRPSIISPSTSALALNSSIGSVNLAFNASQLHRNKHLRADFISGRHNFSPKRLVCRASLNPELEASVDKLVKEKKIVLFMKGTKLFPQCGFSNTVVQILNSLEVPYETVNILEDDGLRQGLKAYSNWPTFPQLYIDGEFFGGCDITLEAFKSGQLKEIVEKAMCS